VYTLLRAAKWLIHRVERSRFAILMSIQADPAWCRDGMLDRWMIDETISEHVWASTVSCCQRFFAIGPGRLSGRDTPAFLFSVPSSTADGLDAPHGVGMVGEQNPEPSFGRAVDLQPGYCGNEGGQDGLL
jgi:hypothetical protein